MDPLVEYHKRIAREIDRSKHDWIANTPQPTMLTGGRRLRQNPLPGLAASTDGAPSTLAVGYPARRNIVADLSGGRRRKRFGWGDIASGLNSIAREVAPIAKDIGKDILKDGLKSMVKGGRRQRNKVVGGYSIGQFARDVAPVALPLMMGLGRKKRSKKEQSYPECVGGETTGGARRGGRQARNA